MKSKAFKGTENDSNIRGEQETKVLQFNGNVMNNGLKRRTVRKD